MRARVLLPVATCVALAATSSPVAGQTALPRGPWVPTWTVVYGGFRQVESLAAADGLAWGVDYTVVSQPTGNVGQTAFVQVVDSGSYTKAAQQLNLHKATVSQQI